MKSIGELLNITGNFELSLHEQNIKLIGSLSKRNTNIVLKCQTNGDFMRELVGNTDKHQICGRIVGTEVTLLECYITESKLVGFDFIKGMLTITPSEIVLGRCTKDEVRVNAISSYMVDLNKMFASKAFYASLDVSKEDPSVLYYAFPKKIAAKDKDGEMCIDRGFEMQDDRDAIQFRIKPFIEFRFNAPTEIHMAMKKTHQSGIY